MQRRLLICTLLAIPAFAVGKDLGIQGTVFPIIEVDMRQALRAQAEGIDQDAINRERKESANRYINNLPTRTLPTPLKTETRLVDLSFKLTSPIQAPVEQADGSWQWRVLYPAGSVSNPVKANPTHRAMLFIDGSHPGQIRLARELSQIAGAALRVVEAGSGSLSKTTEQLGSFVYHADDRLIARFRIDQLPALAYVGRDKERLSVTFAAEPFAVSAFTGWPFLQDKLSRVLKP